MQVRIQYQGTDSSPWMDKLITKKLSKLDRYLSPSASIEITLSTDQKCYKCALFIENFRHDYTFTAVGYNLYESFLLALDMATKTLAEHKKNLKNKIRNRSVA